MHAIRLISDIHLDFDVAKLGHACPEEIDTLWYPEPMEHDSETVLLIAGDLWWGNHAFQRRFGEDSWIERLSRRFKAVLTVLGNHDYWYGNLRAAVAVARESIDQLKLTNVQVLEQDYYIIDNVKFVGGTLWTDFKNQDPNVMLAATRIMNDYEYIKCGTRDLTPVDLFEVHRQTRHFIGKHAVKDYPEQQVVVMTHMAPSYQSIHPAYRTASGYIANFSYFTDLDNFIVNHPDIGLWVHGHCHHPSDYTINKTRVLCNPRGYDTYENTGYDPKLTISPINLDVTYPGWGDVTP